MALDFLEQVLTASVHNHSSIQRAGRCSNACFVLFFVRVFTRRGACSVDELGLAVGSKVVALVKCTKVSIAKL